MRVASAASARGRVMAVGGAGADGRRGAARDWAEAERHGSWRRLITDLLTLRSRDAAFSPAAVCHVDGAVLADEAFALRYATSEPADERLLLINLGPGLTRGSFAEPLLAPPAGHAWRTRWSSEAPEYDGGGAPDVTGPDGWSITAHCAVVLQPEKIDGGDGTTGR